MSTSRVLFKVVIIGEGAVGKTSIRKRYLGEKFKSNYNMTIGADFALKRIEVNDTEFIMQIWDIAGQVSFAKFRSAYYRGAMGALLVYDISRSETFHRLDKWVTELRDNLGKMIPTILIGNKSDLRVKGAKHVSIKSGEHYAKQLSEWSGYDIPYIETSALDGTNIDEAFKILIRNVENQISKDLQDTEKKTN